MFGRSNCVRGTAKSIERELTLGLEIPDRQEGQFWRRLRFFIVVW